MPNDVDKDLQKSLQEARKKPRNFALVAKGANCLKLVVSKKPIRDGEVQKAKKEYQGNATYRGVVTAGDGAELVFQVVGELPPIQEAKLKTFINGETGLTLKARFEVVNELVEIDDSEESESEGQEATTSPNATTEIPSPPNAPPPDDSLGRQIIAALNKLTPSLKVALAAHPERKQDLLQPVASIQQNVQNNHSDTAKTQLLELGRLIKELTGSGTASAGTSQSQDSATAFPKQWAAARQAWQEASDTVDAQISILQGVLRESNDGDLKEIAEFGMNGLTGGYKVPLMAAIRDIDNAGPVPSQELIDNAQEIAEAFREFLDDDEQVAVCDENPFGVTVEIRKQLGPALDHLAQVLASAALAEPAMAS